MADLLNVKRIGGGELPLHRSVFAVERLIRDLIREMANPRITFSPEAYPEIYADEQKVEQVLINLLGNAIKYTPVPGKIGVSLTTANGFARIAVHDEGPGIAKTDQARILNGITRRRSTMYPGWGLAFIFPPRSSGSMAEKSGLTVNPERAARFGACCQWQTIPT